MLLNTDKTTALVMDSSIIFPTENIVLPSGKTVSREVLLSADGHKIVKENTAKLLGVVLSNNLKFHAFVRKKTASANKAL